ncbi:sugar ABC transporter permease, partial [Brucella melitensis]|nr:sugar ABC transporter permease [Brucella melitensis]
MPICPPHHPRRVSWDIELFRLKRNRRNRSNYLFCRIF